jgi:hypothetical protein
MVYHHPGTFLKPPDPRAFLYYLTTGFMAGNNPLVAFRSLPLMFPVNGTDIAAANGGCLGLYQYLSPTRGGDGILFKNGGAVSGQKRPLHGSLHTNLLISIYSNSIIVL